MSLRGLTAEAESRAVPDRLLEVLDRVASRIRPDDLELADWFGRYARSHRQRLAFDLDLVERHVAAGGRLLDCGAVPLLATGALAELGYEVCGVDIRPDRFATAIERLELDVRRCDIEIEPLPFASEQFDAVVFNELLEHLRLNPIATLEEVRRVLKPDGILLLSTPNLRSFRGLRSLVFRHQGSTASGGVYQQFRKLETLGHMGHVREYTAREVADLLGHLGLRAQKVVFRGGYGRGLAGIAERVAPSWRPFFSMIAEKDEGE